MYRETKQRVRLQILDPNADRWEVPFVTAAPNAATCVPQGLAGYEASLSSVGDAFGFSVFRPGTAEHPAATIFDTVTPSGPGLFFADQFISLTTETSEDSVCGPPCCGRGVISFAVVGTSVTCAVACTCSTSLAWGNAGGASGFTSLGMRRLSSTCLLLIKALHRRRLEACESACAAHANTHAFCCVTHPFVCGMHRSLFVLFVYALVPGCCCVLWWQTQGLYASHPFFLDYRPSKAAVSTASGAFLLNSNAMQVDLGATNITFLPTGLCAPVWLCGVVCAHNRQPRPRAPHLFPAAVVLRVCLRGRWHH